MFIVTGASSGIGRATAQALAVRGNHVIVVARSFDRLGSLRDSHPGQITPICADLATAKGLDTFVDAVKAVESIRGIVHAAGSAVPLAYYQDLQTADLLSDMAIHVAAPIALNNRLRDKLTGSRILYIDSYSANAPRVGWAGYSIVKAAAQMASRSAAAEMNHAKVIRVYPGGVQTPLVEAVLTSKQGSPTVDAFKTMEAEGKISDAHTIGAFLTNILLDATEQQLDARESWDFNNPDDRIF